MISNGGTTTLGLYDFKKQLDSFGGVAIISTDTTLNVPSSYATIDAAMSYLRGYMIGDGVTVTIKVADGSYSISSPFDLHHRDGKQINIIGNTTTPLNVVITFSGDGAFILSGAYEIGLIDGIKVSSTLWTSHGNWSTRGGSAVAATFGAVINLGSKMRIEKSYYGVRAAEGGVVKCEAGVTVDEAGDGGFFAFSTGFIECMNCTSTNAADSDNGLGFGFIAENNGTIRADGSTSSGNLISGFFSNTSGSMWAKNTVSNSNGRHGYEVDRLSTAEINGSSANNNSFHGIYVAHNSHALVTGFGGFGNPSGLIGNGIGGIYE